MDLADVMEEVAQEIDKITGLRVYDYPADSVTVPAAIVMYPETYDYDTSMGRGTDRLSLPIAVLVGRASDRASRDQLGSYVDGSGSKSVKQVLEAGTYEAFDSIRVQSVEFDFVSWHGGNFVQALFTCDILGKGSS